MIPINTSIISKYLQFLRKSHYYTQDGLSKKLNVSRQAVSKWETGTAIPDLEVLLKLSKLYGITVNDILEPKVLPQRITDFEQLPSVPEKELKEALQQFDAVSIATASMGASPETSAFLERLVPAVDFGSLRNHIGRVRIEAVEEIQNQIVSMVNLSFHTNNS